MDLNTNQLHDYILKELFSTNRYLHNQKWYDNNIDKDSI